MSNKNSPKPGAKLKQLLELAEKLDVAVAEQALNNDRPGGPEEINGLTEKLYESCDGPDQVKFLHDRLTGEAQVNQNTSDRYSHIAMMYDHVAVQIETRLMAAMARHKMTSHAGETWTAEIKKIAPKVGIDFKKVKDEAPEYLQQVEVIDELKLDPAILAGTPVPGVTVEDQYAIEFTVNKKSK